MQVEKAAGTGDKAPLKVPQKADSKLRKSFAEALRTGKPPSVIAEHLGIALSTCYKWRNRLEELGDAWIDGRQATKAKRIPGVSAVETREHVLKFCLERPKWGAARLAAHLSRDLGVDFSTGTVHSILQCAGLSTRQERALALHGKFVADEVLTEVQRESVGEIDPFAVWAADKAKRPGQALVQGFISIPHASPLGNCRLMMIVDLGDRRAFARFNPDPSSECPNTDFLSDVLSLYDADGRQVKEVFTDNSYCFDRRYDGALYYAFLRKRGIRQCPDPTKPPILNPLLRNAWVALRRYLFVKQKDVCTASVGNRSSLNPLIQGYLEKRFGSWRNGC